MAGVRAFSCPNLEQARRDLHRLLQVYFGKMPHKISHLRADALAIMLSVANVGAYAQVLRHVC